MTGREFNAKAVTMSLAPLLDAAPAIPLHAFAAMAAFVLGSIQMMLRPTIRFVRRTHLQRLRPAQPHETSTDF